MLPRRIPKPAKRASRWRSPAHTKFVSSHACCNCGSMVNVQAAHVRFGSNTGMGQKPDDWRTVSLCGGELGFDGCHKEQHIIGEPRFWASYRKRTGQDVDALIAEFIKASPKRAEIEAIRREREQ